MARRIAPLLWFLASAASLSVSLAQAPVDVQIIKHVAYRQVSATKLEAYRYSYFATVTIPNSGSVGSVRLSGPNNITLALAREMPSSNVFYLSKDEPSQAALDAAVPSGRYVLSATGFANSPVGEFSVADAGTPVAISNYDALQSWPGYGVRILWPAIPGALGADAISVSIFWPGTQFSSWSPVNLLNGTSTEAIMAPAVAMGRPLNAQFMYTRWRSGWRFSVDFNVSVVGAVVSTYAGSPDRQGLVDGPVATASFLPGRMVMDANGDIYLAQVHCVRKISSEGIVSTLAGDAENPGDAEGTGLTARFMNISGIAVDKHGNIYVADSYNHKIKKITPGGVVTRLAGPVATYGLGFGYIDGPADDARFWYPQEVAVDGDGNVYVVDPGNQAVRKISSAGLVSTLARKSGESVDGPLATAKFAEIQPIAAAADGTVYLSDRKISPLGFVTTTTSKTAVDAYRYVDNTGPIGTLSARAFALDRDGFLYFLDHRMVRRLAPSGDVITLAGSGSDEFADGMGSNAAFAAPDALAIAADGAVYVADKGTIRKIVPLARGAPPIITRQPDSFDIGVGRSVVFSVTASGDVSKYQWKRNGIPIAGATSSTLLLSDVQSAAAGSENAYSVEVLGPEGRAISRSVSVYASSANEPARLSNISVRTTSGTQEATLISGFVLSAGRAGTTKPMLIRAIGPGLQKFGVEGFADDPAIALYRGASLLTANEDWTGNEAAQAAIRLGAFPLDSGSKDAALFLDRLEAGTYSIHAVANNTNGIVLAEIYDGAAPGEANASDCRLTNFSVRAPAASGAAALIAGFVAAGDHATTVLVRAVGPGLAKFGITNYLRQPRLTVLKESDVLATNGNWAADPQIAAVAARIGAFALSLSAADADAAVLISLPRGSYTVRVTSPDGSDGVALLEVYEVY